MTSSKPVLVDSDPKLLPCPFCGFQPSLEHKDCLYQMGWALNKLSREDTFAINCYGSSGCSAQIIASSREDCITKWNTRV